VPADRDPLLEDLLAHVIVAASYAAAVAQQLREPGALSDAARCATTAAEHAAAAAQLACQAFGYGPHSARIAPTALASLPAPATPRVTARHAAA
jgi:hypothetical protein